MVTGSVQLQLLWSFERLWIHFNGLQEVLMLLSETAGETTAAHAKRFSIFFQRGPADSFSSLRATPGREETPSALISGQPGTLSIH